MEIDAKEIVRALHLFFCKGDVFEIRCLEAVTERGSNSYQTRPHVESGYFDYNHIENVPAALGHIKSARGIYVTPNPVNPDLLARCANRIMAAQTGSTTNDNHIIRRRWLLIDCDVEHNGISGISSSDEEHANAQQAAEHIRDKLFECNWPDPIIIDTGNGASLMYPIDLDVSAGSNAMIAAVIDALQFYNTKDIKIDPQVKNLARVWRLPGTMNCKGDNIPERPHRMAHLLYVPENGIEFVGRDQLEQIADWQYRKEREKTKATTQTIGYVQSGFDLNQWIRQYCPDVSEPVQQGNQRKWYFKECPFSSGHSSPQGVKDTYIGQYDSGAFFFKCSHSHCANYKFDDLRDLREPDWRTKHSQIDAGVNLSGILNPQTQVQQQDEDEPVFKEESTYFIPFPKELYNVPGIVKSVMELTMKYAPEPNRPLALGGALALMSTLASRKVVSCTNATPNIYLLLIEDSGNGKNFPRTVNKTILYKIGMDDNISDRIASGAGLEDTISKGRTLLWQNDEFQYLLADMGVIKKEDNNNSISQYILTYYTEANSIVKTRSLAGRPGILISRPHLVILGTTTPPEFFDALTERVLRNGLFARMNILLGEGLKEPDLDREDSVLQLDDELLGEIIKWRDFKPTGSGNLDLEPMIVQYTADAKEFDKQLKMKQYQKRKELENDTNDWKSTLWTRFREIANRYALIYACSIAPDPNNTVITIDAVKWGAAFVEWDINNRIKMIENRYFRSLYEKDCMKVIEIMKKWHSDSKNKGLGMPKGTFNQKMGFLTPQQRKDIIIGLCDQKRLLEIQNQGKGGGCKYYLPQFYYGINDNNGQNTTNQMGEKEKNGGDSND